MSSSTSPARVVETGDGSMRLAPLVDNLPALPGRARNAARQRRRPAGQPWVRSKSSATRAGEHRVGKAPHPRRRQARWPRRRRSADRAACELGQLAGHPQACECERRFGAGSRAPNVHCAGRRSISASSKACTPGACTRLQVVEHDHALRHVGRGERVDQLGHGAARARFAFAELPEQRFGRGVSPGQVERLERADQATRTGAAGHRLHRARPRRARSRPGARRPARTGRRVRRSCRKPAGRQQQHDAALQQRLAQPWLRAAARAMRALRSRGGWILVVAKRR